MPADTVGRPARNSIKGLSCPRLRDWADIAYSIHRPGTVLVGLRDRLRSHRDILGATSVQIDQRDGLRVLTDIDGHFTPSGSPLHASYAAVEPTSRTQTWMS